MSIRRVRLLSWLQILFGVAALVLSVFLCSVHLPRVVSLVGSLDRMAAGGERQLVMTTQLLKDTQAVLADVEESVDAHQSTVLKAKSSVQDLAADLKEWSGHTKQAAGILDTASGACTHAAGRLPIDLPSGIKTRYKSFNLRVTSVNVPVGVDVKYREILNEEKEALQSIASELASFASKVGETGELLKGYSATLKTDVGGLLDKANERLETTQSKAHDLRTRTIPPFLAELAAQQAEIDRSRALLSSLAQSIVPAAVVILVLPLVLVSYGLLLHLLIGELAAKEKRAASASKAGKGSG